MIMRSFQVAVIQNINAADRVRPQREESLNEFVKRKETKKEKRAPAPAPEQSSNVVC